jgi:hypothetical protein
MNIMRPLSIGVFLLAATGAIAAETDAEALDQRIRALKQEVLHLNRDLFVLEEELLHPASTQMQVFVSLDVGEYFKLDAVTLKLNDTVVANYLYTDREVAALVRGGVQRLWTGNLKNGEHELIATLTGIGPHGRDYRRGATVIVSKGLGPKYVELRIVDKTANQQPAFDIREWE